MALLSDNEIEALRSLPEFQRALRTVVEIRESEERDAKAEWDAKHKYCPGTDNPKVATKGVKCPKCGLKLNLKDYSHSSIASLSDALRYEHWVHAGGGNPFHRTGLSGKAAAAADGDWYGSH